MARKTDTPASYHESWKAWSGTGTPRLHGEVTGLVSLMESRGASHWRVDRVRSEEAEVMESGCCQRNLTEYPNLNSWHEKAKAGRFFKRNLSCVQN
ncbi:hypothetical protein XENOCAPTIV_012280 [Xenoophorus captivus]|uniref:Uncharacterized protein n=1 Tax=Xenoophorus captivus TaxID=1517983 RepID=A0ABV0RSP7_9TELE